MSASVIGSWADAGDEFPAPEITSNPDGTKTVVSYRYNNDGKKVKLTQKIREIKVKEKVHPLIAQRKNWKKYGKEKNTSPGPDTRTTQLGEKVELNLGTSWKEIEKQEEEDRAQEMTQSVSSQRIKCRICGGDHFTAKCPFKDTLMSESNNASAADTPEPADSGPMVGGKYVPRHLRKDANGNLPPKENTRDDSTTLKISQLNSFVDEEMLANELLAKYILQRITIVRNRETGESRGFAYVSFATESMAEHALENLNGKGYHSLILHLEWSKKRKPVA